MELQGMLELSCTFRPIYSGGAGEDCPTRRLNTEGRTKQRPTSRVNARPFLPHPSYLIIGIH